MAARAVLFSDFNCPFCFANESRLIAAGVASAVEWRGVEHAPHLPIPLQQADPALAAELERETATLSQLAPDLPLRRLTGKPNTRAAILAAIVALRINRERGHEFKLSLYRAVWQQGQDISDLGVLAELFQGAGFEPDDLSLGPEEEATYLNWRAQWAATNTGAVPLIVDRARGLFLPGLQSQSELAALAPD